MATDSSVLVIGLDELNVKLEDLAGLDVHAALMAGGLVVEGHGKMNIIEYDFIDTGATLNSVAATIVGDEVHIGPQTEYAIYGELGIGQSKKPFMRRALEESVSDIITAIAYDLEKQIESKAG